MVAVACGRCYGRLLMDNDSAPATKADIQMVSGALQNLHKAQERWKNEIIADMTRSTAEFCAHFKYVRPQSESVSAERE